MSRAGEVTTVGAALRGRPLQGTSSQLHFEDLIFGSDGNTRQVSPTSEYEARRDPGWVQMENQWNT